MRGRGNVVWVAVLARMTQSLDQNADYRDVEYHLAGRKEPELVWEVERHQLELIRLPPKHSVASGTQLLEKGGTLRYSGLSRVSGGGLVWADLQLPLACVGVHPDSSQSSGQGQVSCWCLCV